MLGTEISSHRYNNITEVRNINVWLTLMSRKNNRDGRARGRHVADWLLPLLAQKNNNIFVLIDIFHPPSMKGRVQALTQHYNRS